MSVARSIIRSFVAGFGSIAFTWIAMPDWLLANLSEHPVQTVLGFLASAVFGGAVVYAAYGTYVSRRLGDRPGEAFDAMRRAEGMAGCRSLSEAADAVHRIAKEKADLERRISDAESRAATTEAAKEVAEPAPRYAEPSVELILQMSPVVASRVYRAYKRGEYIPLSEIEPVAINSIGGRDGLFEYKRFVNPFGQPLEAELYGLSAKWMAFLKDPAKLDQLRAISGGWLSQEE